jgi:hypothetical protein
MRSPDTSPDADRVQREIFARMSGARRIELPIEMSIAMRAISADGTRARHPESEDAQVRHALDRMLLGDRLFHGAWPHAPLLAP